MFTFQKQLSCINIGLPCFSSFLKNSSFRFIGLRSVSSLNSILSLINFSSHSDLFSLQLKIEKLSFISIDHNDINNPFNYVILNDFALAFRRHYLSLKDVVCRSKNPVLYNVLSSISPDIVVGVLFYHFNEVFTYGLKADFTNLNLKVGESVVLLHFLYSLKDEIKEVGKDTVWLKYLKLHKVKQDDLSSLYFDIGSLILTHFSVSTNLLKYKLEYEIVGKNVKTNVYFYLTDFGIKYFQSNINNFIGLKLPLVVKPYLWCKDSRGGYLTEDLARHNGLIHSSVYNSGISIISNDLLYNHVNYTNSIPFIINHKFYNYITEHGYRLNLLIDNIDDLENNPKKDEIKSLFLQQTYILNLSKLYKGHTFYFTLFFDWRGRIYTDTTYLTYQGNDLGKAMLEFKDGGLISQPEHFDVLLAYGASLYGLGHSSFSERVSWTLNNWDKVVAMDDNFILSAKEPLLFIAWSLEIIYNKDNIATKTPYISHFPIQWDATCNGLQHLSLLCNDEKLAESVNICPSTYLDKPKDVYTIMLNYILDKIKELVNSDPNLSVINLSKFPLSREFIKKSIMTIPYSVTLMGIKEQLASQLTLVKHTKPGSSKNEYYYELRNKDNISYKLNNKELLLLAKLIHNSIFELHPKLKVFIKFWLKISEILHDLDVSIKWMAPNGLLINQKYIHFDKITIFYKIFSKNKKVILQKPNNKINLRKQKSGILPNLIHSLDASTLTILVNKLKVNGYNVPFYSVHDCFASTANNMSLIKKLYKESLVDIYNDNKVLKIFEKDLLQYIDELVVNDEKVAEIIKLKTPSLKLIINPNLNKKLMKNLKESFNIIV